jgi:hypothetical protein
MRVNRYVKFLTVSQPYAYQLLSAALSREAISVSITKSARVQDLPGMAIYGCDTSNHFSNVWLRSFSIFKAAKCRNFKRRSAGGAMTVDRILSLTAANLSIFFGSFLPRMHAGGDQTSESLHSKSLKR